MKEKKTSNNYLPKHYTLYFSDDMYQLHFLTIKEKSEKQIFLEPVREIGLDGFHRE